MSDGKIKVELYTSFDVDGIHSSVFFEDNDSPSAQETISWDDLMDKEIEYHTLMDKTTVPNVEVQELLDVVKKLRSVATDLENRIMELKVFDREQWIQEKQTKPIENYCTAMEEYLTWKKTKENFERDCG